MKKTFAKKITVSLLILTLSIGSLGLFPNKSYAVLGVGDSVVEVGPSLYQQIANTINTTASTFSQYSLQLKAYVLDTLATTLAKQLIRQLTASVVNWINTGFKGDPTFVTNPGTFFLDVADQVTGNFLSKAGGPLTQLCSNFSIDIQIALAFKYHSSQLQPYECTLGKIISNTTNAVKGASINGFTAGDFKQGGWPAFVSLTEDTQNNAMGAYLQAEDDLSIRVAGIQLRQKDELNQGKGFLSWHDCSSQTAPVDQGTVNPYSSTAQNAGDDYVAPNVPTTNGGTAPVDYDPSGETLKTVVTVPSDSYIKPGTVDYDPFAMAANKGVPPVIKSNCPVKTPGDIIVSSLETSVNGPLHELELVDSINQIVNALAAQLISQVLQAGLGSVSGNGPSDPNAYLNQVQNDIKAGNDQLNSVRTELLKNIDTYINNTAQYKSNKDQSLNTMLDVKSTYDSATACYTNKINNSQPPLNASQISAIQSKISIINSAVATNVTPLANQLLTKAQEADQRLSDLTVIKQAANAAQTVNDLNAPSQKYSQLLQSQSLTSAQDIIASQQELAQTQDAAAPLKQDAQRKLQECQVFSTTSGF